jgi:WD40 repeat protein
MHVEWTLQSLAIIPSENDTMADVIFQSDSKYRCQVRVEPSRGLLVCNGYPGHLQLYDLVSQAFHSSIEVVRYVRVSKTEKHTRIYAPSVTHFCFGTVSTSRCTQYYLATVDVRRGEEIGVSDSIKLWQYSAAGERYLQVAQMDRPHGLQRVVSVCMQQGDVGCVTSATDGSVKLWTTTAASDANSDAEPQWVCRFSFTYRECPVNAVQFSQDASLLALAHENVVSFWDPTR